MSTHHDHRPSTGPVTVPVSTRGSEPGERITDGGGPPLRSKVTAALAVLACAACCALPLVIGAGLLTGAGAALAEQTLLAVAGLLIAAAAGMWWLHRRRASRTTAGVATSPVTGGRLRLWWEQLRVLNRPVSAGTDPPRRKRHRGPPLKRPGAADTVASTDEAA